MKNHGLRKLWTAAGRERALDGLCPHETAGRSSGASETHKLLRRTAVRREMAAEAFAAERSVHLLIVVAFPTADCSRPSSPEAELEVKPLLRAAPGRPTRLRHSVVAD
jgi:hypothetical protein